LRKTQPRQQHNCHIFKMLLTPKIYLKEVRKFATHNL
jgi:hypothetical protein